MHVVIAGVPSRYHIELAPVIQSMLAFFWPSARADLSLLPCEKPAVLTIMVFGDVVPPPQQSAVRLLVADVCAAHASGRGWWHKGFYFDPLQQRPKVGTEKNMPLSHRLRFAFAGGALGLMLSAIISLLGLLLLQETSPALVERLFPPDNLQVLEETSTWFLRGIFCGTVAGVVVGGTALAQAVWKEEHP